MVDENLENIVKSQRDRLYIAENLESFIADNEIEMITVLRKPDGQPISICFMNINKETVKIPLNGNSFTLDQVQDVTGGIERKLNKNIKELKEQKNGN